MPISSKRENAIIKGSIVKITNNMKRTKKSEP